MLNHNLEAPDCRCDINNTAFSIYALHQHQVEEFIDRLSLEDDPNDAEIQHNIAKLVGLDLESLTINQIKYIEREVSKKYESRY